MAPTPALPARSRVQSGEVLVTKLAAVLPKGDRFGAYHISTPPTRTDALFHAPPGRRADRTYIESHFLAVTINVERDAAPATDTDQAADQVIVFALEVFIFTTAFSSTFFVSKADSSGYLHLLQLPKGTPSPIREVSSAFVSYLVEQRRREGVQSVVSLFARAQSQYLFPGSVDNAGKHVLDDRGLVKWWCRVLDPLLAGEQPQKNSTDGEAPATGNLEPWKSVEGYLIVPGLDQYETRAFLPRTPGGQPQPHWTLGHPLEKISHYVREQESAAEPEATAPTVPPRCLIPRYPDDPKARYLDELDDEAERAGQKDASALNSSANFGSGMWKSVRTLDQFWEMMAFRQECSSGRLTGFIWVVFDPASRGAAEPAVEAHGGRGDEAGTRRRRTGNDNKKKKGVLKGYIIPRTPRAKKQQREYLARRPESTPHYYWPAEGRGRLLVDDADYKRINELLLQLDFSTLEKGAISTRRWIKEAGMGSEWRLDVTGDRPFVAPQRPPARAAAPNGSMNGSAVVANDLSGLVKRKRDAANAAGAGAANAPPTDASGASAVNVLGGGLIRKKPKVV